MRRILAFGLGMTVIFGITTGVEAKTTDIVRVIPSNTDSRTRQMSPIEIPLTYGYGVNISFLSAQETIEKLWLDNPSFVVVDADGCLSGLSGSQSCAEGQGAGVLHLRRIKDLAIPGLPKIDQCLLTVVTRHLSGTRKLYVFKIAKATLAKQLVFEIVPNPTVNVQPKSESAILPIIRRGVQEAQRRQWLEPESPLNQKLQTFIDHLQSGMAVEEAAKTAQVSLSLVEQLQRLGNGN